jgi:hypothetical protein
MKDFEGVELGDDWAHTPWNNTYRRPKDLWTCTVYGPDASEPLCYDLAEAIRAWLKSHPQYKRLSMCEVALVDPRFAEARGHVKPAETFWSHVQQETVGKMFKTMIEKGGGGLSPQRRLSDAKAGVRWCLGLILRLRLKNVFAKWIFYAVKGTRCSPYRDEPLM